MPTPTVDIYPAANGATLHGGRGTPIVVGPPDATPANFQVYGDGIWGNSASYTAAVYSEGATYLGVSSQSGGARIVRWDNTAGTATTFSLNGSVGPSDHSAPTIIVRSDGRLLAMYCLHNDSTGMRYRISTNPHDVSAWGTEQLLTTGAPVVTYAYVVQLDAVMVLFFRNGQNFFYRTSTDQGSTWSGVTWCFTYDNELGRPYPQPLRTSGTRIDFVLCQQAADLSVIPSIYHCSATWTGAAFNWANTAGTAITLPVDAADGDATLIYNDGTAYTAFWATITRHSDGNLWVLLKRLSSATNVEYLLVRQSGSSWLPAVSVAPGGYPTAVQPDYTGDCCFDPIDPTKVYASRGTAAGGPMELALYSTSDAGATWAKLRDITSGSGTGVRNFRPVAIVGAASGGERVAFVSGSYTGFTAYSTAVRLAS